MSISSSLSVLVISSGTNQDRIGAVLASQLRKQWPSSRVSAFPLGGWGDPYHEAGVPVLGAARKPLAHGRIRRGLASFWRDIQTGCFLLPWRHTRALRSAQYGTDLVICAGDLYPLFMAYRYVRKPIVFLPTLKSEQVQKYFSFEKGRIQRHCQLVFPPDEFTAQRLRESGVAAVYLGNPLVDGLEVTDTDFGVAKGPVISILPGTGLQGYQKIMQAAAAAQKTAQLVRDAQFLIPVASGLARRGLVRRLQADGWQFRPAGADAGQGQVGQLVKDGCVLQLIAQRDGGVIKAATVCIGLDPVRNQQALGMGKPVITFPANGRRLTAATLQAQEKAIGEALLVVKPNPDAVAKVVHRTVTNSALSARLALAGKVRTGGVGVSARMCEKIQDLAFELGLLP